MYQEYNSGYRKMGLYLKIGVITSIYVRVTCDATVTKKKINKNIFEKL